ncbi:MAG: hypothetical protein PHU12_01650 [Candidatus Aenigmarchaeota archaeon]|nr:hypothetical protein [Candidatus Aenigmarchaeota archaeon]
MKGKDAYLMERAIKDEASDRRIHYDFELIVDSPYAMFAIINAASKQLGSDLRKSFEKDHEKIIERYNELLTRKLFHLIKSTGELPPLFEISDESQIMYA